MDYMKVILMYRTGQPLSTLRCPGRKKKRQQLLSAHRYQPAAFCLLPSAFTLPYSQTPLMALPH